MRSCPKGGSTDVILMEVRRRRRVGGGGEHQMKPLPRFPYPKVVNSYGRTQLAITVPGMGQVPWHQLLFWAFSDKRDFATWDEFRARDQHRWGEVDHGDPPPSPDVVRLDRLCLRLKGGVHGNAAQARNTRARKKK